MAVIKVLYEDTAVDPAMKPAWGFAALIEHGGQNILFDTGGDLEIFANNAAEAGLDPEQIKTIMISHDHWDHINGLPVVLQAGQKVFLLGPFSKKLKQQVLDAGAKVEVVDKFCQILPGMYSTGALSGKTMEQSLVLDTEQGLVVITGCSHPGIVNILKCVKRELGKKVHFVIGGFHLYEMSQKQVRQVIKQIKELGVAKVAACHCTGVEALKLFEQEFKNDFIKVGAGSIIVTADL